MEQVKDSNIAKVDNTRKNVKKARIVVVNKRKLVLSCLLVIFMTICVIYGIKEWKKTTNAIQQDAKLQTGTKLEKSAFPDEVFDVPVHTTIIDIGSKRKTWN